MSRLIALVLRNKVPMPPRPPSLDTAAASSADVQVPIGTRMIGTSMPKMSQRGVLSMASPTFLKLCNKEAKQEIRADEMGVKVTLRCGKLSYGHGSNGSKADIR